MYVRLLFVLLAALNLGAAGWLLFAGAPPQARARATDPGVPELQLVTEATSTADSARVVARAAAVAAASAPAQVGLHPTPGGSSSAAPDGAPRASAATTVAPAASAPAPATAAASAVPGTGGAEACTSLGPFTSEADVRAALETLAPHIARIRYREVEVSRPHGYWVYLPPAASRDGAQAEARALAAKGVRDYYIMGGGDTPNAISLGVYNDAVNAQHRVAQVEQLGFTAKVKRRVDAEPAYWLDFAAATGTAFRGQTWLPDRANLAAKPVGCF